MKPYPNEELDRMSKREIIRLYKRTVEQFNDAVPVIRCKDCVHYKQSKVLGNACALTDNHVTKKDYCSKAERKENGN